MKTIIISLISLFISLSGFSQTLELVKDINTTQPYDIRNHNSVTINNVIYYSFNDGIKGRELWKSDGTVAGTVLLADIILGSESSNPVSLFSHNGVLYFFVANGTTGLYALYKSDGTTAGTVLVKTFVSSILVDDVNDMVSVGTILYFRTRRNSSSYGDGELWKTDGTNAGTTLIKSFISSNNAGASRGLINLNGILIFSATGGPEGEELWKSDGTTAGTVLLKNINTIVSNSQEGASNPFYLTKSGNHVYFVADPSYANQYDKGLWRTDGTTAGTQPVITSGTIPYDVERLFDAGGGILYFSEESGKLWKTDGTNAGSTILSSSVKGRYFCKIGSTTYFASTNGTQLWKTDGTVVGTQFICDFFDGADYVPIHEIVNRNGILYIITKTRINYTGTLPDAMLWKSDGTGAGTQFLKYFFLADKVDLYESWSAFIFTGQFCQLTSGLYFFGNDGATGDELWKTDGTVAGTTLLTDVNQISIGSYSSYGNMPYGTVGNDGLFYFRAYTNATGAELWKSDGTAAGTSLIRDFNYASIPGNESNNPNNFFAFPNAVFYEGNGNELINKTDGTFGGTTPVEINGSYLQKSGIKMVRIGDFLYYHFAATNEIRRTNGVAWETVISNIQLDVNDESAFKVCNGLLYFIGSIPNTFSNNLWRSDGTTAGTFALTSLPIYKSILDIFVAGNQVYFQGDGNISNKSAIYVTNGTVAGTSLVKDDLSFSGFVHYIPQNNRLLFNAGSSTNYQELYSTDGTTAGTLVLRNAHALNKAGDNSVLYFTQTNSGTDLWKTDGTVAGTILVKNFASGTIYIDKVHNGKVYFFGGYISGTWVSDGTTAGTILLINQLSHSFAYNGLVYLGTSGLPGALYKTNGTVAGTSVVRNNFAVLQNSGIPFNGSMLLYGTDGLAGEELWKLTAPCSAPPSPPTVASTSITAGNTASVGATCQGSTTKWYDQPTDGTLLQTGASFTTPVLYSSKTYYVSCESGLNCASVRAPVSVTVVVQPPTQPGSFTASTTPVCQGQSSVAYGIPAVNGVTYTWTYSGTGATLNATGSSVLLSFAANATSGTLSVVAANSAGNSPARTLSITVNTAPGMPTATAALTVASGSVASLTATGCSTYSWYAQVVGGVAGQTGASASFTTPALYANTTYYVACTNGGCESGRQSIPISVTGGSGIVSVAHYPFCGNANDASPNANHGTVNGATLTTDRFGNANSAYSFNGSSSFISVPGATQNNFGTANFSTSIWFKTSSTTPVLALYTKTENNGPDYAGINAYVNLSNIGSVRARTDFNNAAEATGSYNNGQWHLMTFTRNGTVHKIYVDGVLKATQTAGSVINVSQNTPLIIGRNTNAQYHFDGSLDDFKLYDVVLSDAQVMAEFAVSCQQASCSAPTVISPAVANSGPINTGQPVSFTATNLAPRGQAISLNAANSQYIEVAQSLPADNFTIELWVKTASANGGLFSAGSSPLSNLASDRHIYIEGGILKARILPQAIPGFSSGVLVNDNNWHHIALTHKTTGSEGSKLYVDGQLAITVATADACDNNLPLFRIGVEQNTGWYNQNPNNFFTGQIDNVRVWNVARTQPQIRESAQSETPSTATGLIYQSSLNGNATGSTGTNGTLMNAPTFAPVTHYTYTWTGQNAPTASTNETQTTTGAAGPNYTLTVLPAFCGTTISNSTTVTINNTCTQMVSLKTGNWTDPTVWSCNRIPAAGDVVTVAASHVVSIGAGVVGVCKTVQQQGRLVFGTGGRLQLGQN